MKTSEICDVLALAPWMDIPEQFRKDLDTYDDLPYINTCGYEFMNSNLLTPDVINGVNFLPYCILHDWRRNSISSLIGGVDQDILKRTYDIEFITNLLTAINRKIGLSNKERMAMVEIAYLYGQCVCHDQIVTGKPFYVKLWNIIKVIVLVMWFPIKSIIRHVIVEFRLIK